MKQQATQQANEFQFLDRWFIPHDIQTVWDHVTDTSGYTQWWASVYDEANRVESGDANGVGAVTKVLVHGPLPYKLRMRLEATAMEKPYRLEVKSTGDLVGRGIWTLRSVPGGTQLEYDWRVRADFWLIRLLAPILKPAFAYNHNWCMRQGELGLTRWLAPKGNLQAAGTD